MAKCDQGYCCDVCGRDVDSILDSDLYLRFVIGRVDPQTLHLTPERHLRCNPVTAQFIRHPDFEPVEAPAGLSAATLDPDFVRSETDLVTRGYLRLREITRLPEPRDVTSYPLKEVLVDDT